jgi:hypothetical protein
MATTRCRTSASPAGRPTAIRVYQNGAYNDPFVIVLMLTGQLQPK